MVSNARALIRRAFSAIKRLERHRDSGKVPVELESNRYREVICGPCRVFFVVPEESEGRGTRMATLPGITVLPAKSIAQAQAVAEKIRVKVASPYELQGTREGTDENIVEHHCSASIGVFVFLGHEARADDILKRADRAMYHAKAEGRNRIRCYEDDDQF